MKDETKVVFSGTFLQADMVAGILRSAGIEAYVKDGIIGTLGPWWAAPGGAGAVKVIVLEKDYEDSVKIVEEYENNIRE